MRRRFVLLGLTMACWLLPRLASAADFQPDPASVQRYGPAYRYPQEGWIVVHVEGDPYERGCQQGRLLAPEIAAHIRCLAATQSHKAPADAWKQARTLVNALWLRRYDKEYLEEMKGIAEGASAAGARFHGRAIDLLDVVAINSWPEFDMLDDALEATPTGLEGLRLSPDRPKAPAAPKPTHCSAFAAVGPATADGKIVFGHITMWNLYPTNFFNVWLDVKPTKGHRVLMQTYPGGIQSGLDYYLNDAGLLVSETTLAQTRFDSTGMSAASRIRQALQYADSIDGAVEILKKDNNGLYTNEWLLADLKTNEIAMFELGTHKSRLYRSKDGEWFGGTEGFYWGCNNTKDLDVRMETVASVDGRPADVVFRPSDRDKKWLELYDKHKGKIDADFGKLAFTTAPIAAYHSCDAKFTTTEMAKDLKTWALYGPPLGRTWQPSDDERKNYPEIRPLVSNPWTVLHAGPPAVVAKTAVAVDLHDPEKADDASTADKDEDAEESVDKPAWHGTLLPKADADVWLSTAFADYERIVAKEKARRKANGGQLTDADRDELAVDLYAHRANYNLGARAHPEAALNDTKADLRQSDWHRVASGKGVLLLADLRDRLGAEAFDALMDQFGREHAGKATTAAEFHDAVQKHWKDKATDDFFNPWLTEPGLPRLKDHKKEDGGPFSVLTFHAEPERALIVYGTGIEANADREAAEALQKAILVRGTNITVPMASDRDVTEEDLKTHHILLIGRPDDNRVAARFRDRLPIAFGERSFVVRGETYAHADSAVYVAAENPLNRRYSMVVIAGLDSASTLRAAPQLVAYDRKSAEVVVLPHGGTAKSLVLPGKELTRELEDVGVKKGKSGQ